MKIGASLGAGVFVQLKRIPVHNWMNISQKFIFTSWAFGIWCNSARMVLKINPLDLDCYCAGEEQTDKLTGEWWLIRHAQDKVYPCSIYL